MKNANLPFDPYNIIITGVGGQGNVMASRVVGNILSRKGLSVTIGETFGASQRGGSVMSHLRVSSKSYWSPQIPKGQSHLIVSLEPTEAIRVLMTYGNPEVNVVCNTRPVHSIGVISGDQQYPSMDDVTAWVDELSAACWFIDATEKALELGNSILGNIMMIGAVAGIGDLPLDKASFREVIGRMMAADKIDLNVTAFEMGVAAVRS